MREKIQESLESTSFRKIEEIYDTPFEWAFLVHSGSDKDFQNSYKIPVYKTEESDNIIIRASASFSEHHQSVISDMYENDNLTELQYEINSITNGTDIIGSPEDEGGESCPLMYAKSYTFYQYFFPEDFSRTLLMNNITRAMNCVDHTWTLLWYFDD